MALLSSYDLKEKPNLAYAGELEVDPRREGDSKLCSSDVRNIQEGRHDDYLNGR